jgi:hypothetical protein
MGKKQNAKQHVDPQKERHVAERPSAGGRSRQQSGRKRTKKQGREKQGAKQTAQDVRVIAAEKVARGKRMLTSPPKARGTTEFPPIKRHRRKRVRLGEAFRKAGLDEQTVAETYVGVVGALREKTTQDTVQKLLVDVLKECSRVLDQPRGTDPGANEAPAIVELHHSVARPMHDLAPERENNETV